MNLLDPDPGAEVAGLLMSQFATENFDIELMPVSLRLPASRLAFIDAMAVKAAVSRNRMLNLLLSTGCNDVVSRLAPEVLADLAEAAGEIEVNWEHE